MRDFSYAPLPVRQDYIAAAIAKYGVSACFPRIPSGQVNQWISTVSRDRSIKRFLERQGIRRSGLVIR